METVVSIKPLLAVAVSLAAAVLILVSGKNPNLRESWSILAGIIKFLIVISMAPLILQGKVVEYTFLTILPGVDIKFRVDNFGLFFATTASFLWIFTSVYSIGYMRSLNYHAQTRYFSCFAIALSSAMGVAFAANLFTLYLFYEILTISTYPLVAHKETEAAFFAGWKYFVYLFGTAFGQLAALILVYNYAGTLEFSPGGILSATSASPIVLKAIYALFIFGFTKSAMIPLHTWLPTAMIAPTPVSALLHAVAVVKAGVFSVLRIILYVFGVELMQTLGLNIATAYFVSFTIIVASLFAITQDNLKLRLAYSTVSQLSYIILGAALAVPYGVVGGIFHIAAHAFGKITLFFCAGSIYVASHFENISQMDGIGRRMPLTMLAFTVGALSMIGFPPFAGFSSKWYLVLGSIEAGQIPILIVLLVSSLLNGIYFLPIVYRAFFEAPKEEAHGKEIKEAPFAVVAPLLVSAIGTIIIFFYPGYFLSLAKGC